jgi:hypothetical protein
MIQINNVIWWQWQHEMKLFFQVMDKFNEEVQLHVESWAMP